MPDESMETRKIVAWNGGIHVMLRVEVHLPVKETHNRAERKRAAAEAKVRHVVLEADVLRVVAKKKQPSSIERSKRGQYGDDPLASEKRHTDDQPVPDEQ